MPMNMPLPTNAKITALVCSGRSRPKVVNWQVQVQRPARTAGMATSRPALHADEAPDDGGDRERPDDAVVVFERFDLGAEPPRLLLAFGCFTRKQLMYR